MRTPRALSAKLRPRSPYARYYKVMSRDTLIMWLADRANTNRLIRICNHLNRKMPTGVTIDGKRLNVNLIELNYMHGYRLDNIAYMIGIKKV